MRTCILGAAVLLVVGCGKRPSVIYDRPSFPEGERYELAWIDPELVFSDTLFTLIRSERIDSVYVEKSDTSAWLIPSVRFDVPESECNVAVNLLDAHLRVVMPLFVRRVPAGYYKLTFSRDRFSGAESGSASYFLQVDFCGRTVRKAFVDH